VAGIAVNGGILNITFKWSLVPIFAIVSITMGAAMDNRKTFVIGISIIFGLSLDLLPALFVDVPNAVRPLFESALTLSTVLAVVLNQVLRLGELVKTT
jgi:xanthine permease XanP